MTTNKGNGGGERPKGRRPRVRSGDVLIVLIVATTVAVLYNYDLSQIVGFLYNKYVGLVLLLLILEFLWIKSGDRTRVYYLEIEKLRASRRRDEALLRNCREVIDLAIQYPVPEGEGKPGGWMQQARNTIKDLKERL